MMQSGRMFGRRRAVALLASAPLFGACKRGTSTPRVGSKNFSESILLGEIVAQAMVKWGGLKRVERKASLGGTFVCHGALVSGDIDAYVEYTGTALVAILKDSRSPPLTDAKLVRAEVERAWKERFHAQWMPPLGFEDTFAILVRRADGVKHGWKTVSDLAADPDAEHLRPGFGYEFVARSDGYDAFARAYGLRFARKPVTMELGLTYRALTEKKVDVIAGNSTDGIIDKLDLVQLVDDKHFFPPYEAAPVVREAVLKEHPSLVDVFKKLEGTIPTERMRKMNYAVDSEGKDAVQVARAFLEERDTP